MRTKTRNAPALCAMVVAVLSALHGAMADAAANPAEVLELPTVEVVGTTPVPGIGTPIKDVPSNVQIYTAKDMAKQKPSNISEFLEKNPTSVTINSGQGNPFQPDVNFRGFTASPLLGTPQGLSVFLDGVRINEPFGDVVNWDLIPQSAISSIQLIPGSNPTFGLNTLGGALAVYTKSGSAYPGTSIDLTGGSFGRRSAGFETGGKNGNLDYFVTGNYYKDDGWAEHNPSRIKQFFGKVGYQTDQSDLDVSLALADNALQGTQSLPLSFFDNRRQAYTFPDRNTNKLTFLNVKGSHFFTDDVRGQHARFVEAGFEFLAPPVDYAVPWGHGAVATEAHLPTEDGVKISLAKMARVPRIAMGRSARESAFTEVAAATQIVKDFGRAEAFYCDVLDLVPAAPTVIEGELIAALRLPPGTRLRMSFLSGRQAAGGRVGIVAYDGPGVADARSLASRVRAPHRGILGLTFEVEDVEYVTRKAVALGATVRCAPSPQSIAGAMSFGSTVVSPDGIPLYFEVASGAATPDSAPSFDLASGFSSVCRIDELPPGSIREHRPRDGSPRVALANVAGEVFAFEDRCPHLGAPLSRGEMRGRTLVCPWHGWMIDVPTGFVTGGRGAAVRACPARVRDGRVEVKVLGKDRE